MSDTLVTRIEFILSNLDPARTSEEATKLHIILPILSALGWDAFNAAEVVPEDATDENKRVDYGLTLQGKRRVFIEAKRIGVKLESHQKQLLGYAFERGVELAVLTNGTEWWFYLPLRPGDWQQRRFEMLDLERTRPYKAAEELTRFLSRSAVASGEAVENAQQVFDSVTRRRAVRRALPEVWAAMQAKPDDELVTLIQQRVEAHCGHLPTADEVAELLGAQPPPKVSEPPHTKPVEASTQGAQKSASAFPLEALLNGYPLTRTKPQALCIDGSRIEVRNWAALSISLVRYLTERGELRAEHIPVRTHAGKKRLFVNSEPKHLDPKLGGKWHSAGPFFADTNFSAVDHVRNIAATLDHLGLDAGRVAIELRSEG